MAFRSKYVEDKYIERSFIQQYPNLRYIKGNLLCKFYDEKNCDMIPNEKPYLPLYTYDPIETINTTKYKDIQPGNIIVSHLGLGSIHLEQLEFVNPTTIFYDNTKTDEEINSYVRNFPIQYINITDGAKKSKIDISQVITINNTDHNNRKRTMTSLVWDAESGEVYHSSAPKKFIIEEPPVNLSDKQKIEFKMNSKNSKDAFPKFSGTAATTTSNLPTTSLSSEPSRAPVPQFRQTNNVEGTKTSLTVTNNFDEDDDYVTTNIDSNLETNT